MVDLTEKVKGIRHERERQFAANFFNHDDWDAQPCFFRLKDGTKYFPDFRDNSTGEYIEVIGSRQAFYNNKKKYLMFLDEYPDVNFSFYLHTGKKAKVFTRLAELSLSTPSLYANYSYPTTRCNYDLRYFRKKLDRFFIETMWTYRMFNHVAGMNLQCVESVLSGCRPYCSKRDFEIIADILAAYDARKSDFMPIENKYSAPIKAINSRKAVAKKRGRHFYHPGLPFRGARKSNGRPAA